MSTDNKPSGSLSVPNASPSVQAAIVELYSNTQAAAALTPTSKPLPYIPISTPDASPSVQAALLDLSNKLSAYGAAKQLGITVGMSQPFTRLPITGATPDVYSAINDLYDRVTLLFTSLKG